MVAAVLTFGKLGRLNFFLAFLEPLRQLAWRKTMKTTALLSAQTVTERTLSAGAPSTNATTLTELVPSGTVPREFLRHILLGSPEAVRQTIHLLHRLHYSETVLWSPVMAVEESLIITPAQGEAMSLLRKQV